MVKKFCPTMSTSNVQSMIAGNGVSDEFPVGLRVLVVDEDSTSLRNLESRLELCGFKVTKCERIDVALTLLRENKDGFDIVISDVMMPHLDDLKLLELVAVEMDLPVIMMSADNSKHVLMTGVIHGACDFLIKPISFEILKNIWLHVVRKNKNDYNRFDLLNKVDFRIPREVHTSSQNRIQLKWSVELHQKFVRAVNLLGVDEAVPKNIFELMDTPELTRAMVATHLQKYRSYLKGMSSNKAAAWDIHPQIS